MRVLDKGCRSGVATLGAILAIGVMLSGCALLRPHAGASLRKGMRQVVRFQYIREVRERRGYVWIAGGGSAIVDDGGGLYFWNSTTPAHLEVTVERGKDRLESCWETVRKSQETGRPLLMEGTGFFSSRHLEKGGFLGLLRLNSLSSCASDED